MQLKDLLLNRFLYRDNGNVDPSQADSSAYINTGPVSSDSGSTTVLPGSPPIQSVLLQSSGGPDRVEINPSDNFFAYNNNLVVVQINKDGITATNSNVLNENVSNLNVTTLFTYDGIPQPVVFVGEVNSDGTPALLPVGWSSSVFGVGTYIIDHTMNTTNYEVFCAPLDGHFRYQVAARNLTNFIIDWQQTKYGSATFPVSGGGGGSVTVDGVRLPPGEESIDTAFSFVVFRLLP